jgi:hypothetical protein
MIPPLENAASHPWGTGAWLRAIVFVVSLFIWTWKLIEPFPVPEELIGDLSLDLRFILAKILHGCSYAYLAFLSLTLPMTSRWHLALIGFLALHGVGTEIAQAVLPHNRHGCIQDVLIDWTGITAGTIAFRLFERFALFEPRTK